MKRTWSIVNEPRKLCHLPLCLLLGWTKQFFRVAGSSKDEIEISFKREERKGEKKTTWGLFLGGDRRRSFFSFFHPFYLGDKNRGSFEERARGLRDGVGRESSELSERSGNGEDRGENEDVSVFRRRIFLFFVPLLLLLLPFLHPYTHSREYVRGLARVCASNRCTTRSRETYRI